MYAAQISAAFQAADSGNGELLLTRDYVLGTTDQIVLSGSSVKIAAQRGGRIVVGGTSGPTAQAPAKPWTGDQPAPELWWIELGLDQGACHARSPHGPSMGCAPE